MNIHAAALALLVALAGAGGVAVTTDLYALDSDGLTTVEELQHGTDPLDPDTDGDGLNDTAVVRVHATDPTHSYTDGNIG